MCDSGWSLLEIFYRAIIDWVHSAIPTLVNSHGIDDVLRRLPSTRKLPASLVYNNINSNWHSRLLDSIVYIAFLSSTFGT